MGMEMGHGLARGLPLIDHQPVALGKALLLGNHPGRIKNMLMIARRWQRGQTRNFGSRNDENVHRGDGLDVSKCHYMLIFENNIRRDFPIDDLCEERCHELSNRCYRTFSLQSGILVAWLACRLTLIT